MTQDLIGFQLLIGKSSPLYKYIKDHSRLGVSNQSNLINLLLFYFLFFFQTLALPTPICYSSSISISFEDALGGLLTLEQPKDSYAPTAPPEGRSLDPHPSPQTGLTSLPHRSDRFAHWSHEMCHCVLHVHC